LAFTVVILGGTAYVLLSYSLVREVDNALNGVAKVLAERVQGGSTAFYPADINEIFRRFLGFSPWEPYYQMIDPRSRHEPHEPPSTSEELPLSAQALENATRGLSTFETVTGGGPYPLRTLTLPVMQGRRLHRLIRIGMSLQNASETRLRFLLIMAALLPIGLLLAGLGGWLLARRALQPVDRMAEAAQRISAEHLAERLQETGAGDELDRLAQTLNRMLTRLDTAFNQIRQFSADASHELQTPLTILKGELEVALRSSRSPEEYRETLKSALEEIDRIAQLLEGLLILARTEAGVLRVDQQPLDLAQLAEEVFWRLKGQADSHAVDLRLGDIETAPILGDRERLRRLLINLVENGIKYTPPGGSVSLSLHWDGDQVRLEVADTGIGISPEDQERIFQPFFRSEDALTKRGSGLGLSIAHSIAAAHGGSIEVNSTPDHGSTFTVDLPVERET
jgi:heavy metal sensor kinase